MINSIALVASIILPLWNIPLIIRIIKRKSSDDISIYWVIGVWVCLLCMFPSGIRSEDIVWKVFNMVNLLMFSLVFLCVLFFRGKNKKQD